MKFSLISMFMIALAGTTAAQEVHVVVRGRDGLVKVPMTFTNAGPAPMACKSAIAHWYSLDLGIAAEGAKVSVDLWSDPKSGEIFLLNDKEDRMPIQSLWCGLEGRSWETRAEIVLSRRAGDTPAAENLVCTQAENRVTCKAI
ncbi:hypothetical protein LJR030_004543 [Rhizobium sp. LjRoot30]|uniref:hypothetical protein n=1 Tax=Rhizobium sp. LjRoot30 TaxID=3342320 RepID=UPI003ECFD673